VITRRPTAIASLRYVPPAEGADHGSVAVDVVDETGRKSTCLVPVIPTAGPAEVIAKVEIAIGIVSALVPLDKNVNGN